MNRTKQAIPYFAILSSLWIFMIYTGVIGIDFGKHWDERKLIKSVRDSIPNGEIIPGWYNYPSMTYDLVVASSSPEILSAYFYNRPQFNNIMEKWFSSKPMILRARTVFLFTTSLTMIWICLLAFKWTGKWIPGILGSAIFASSWEIAYHARWLAPDGILMQFGILTILFVFVALYSDTGRSRFIWLTTAAVTAGLACGTKYYGGIFLVPVFIGGLKILRDAGSGLLKSAALLASLITVFALVFLIVTPGLLVEPDKFIQDVRFEIKHYQNGHPGYSVNPGIEHAALLFSYLSLVAFSKYPGIAILFFIFTIIGVFVTIRRSWNKYETWIFLSVPLLYIPYMSLQKVMFVRNYLLLFPFFAILTARGIWAVWHSYPLQRYSAIRLLLGSGLALALFINLAWLYSSAISISNREHVDQTRELYRYLLENNQTKYYLSTPSYRFISPENLDKLSNIVDEPSLADFYIYLSHEVANPQANKLGIYTPILGPFEVNFDYYPSWDGDSRIIIMRMKDALPQSQFDFQNEQ